MLPLFFVPLYFRFYTQHLCIAPEYSLVLQGQQKLDPITDDLRTKNNIKSLGYWWHALSINSVKLYVSQQGGNVSLYKSCRWVGWGGIKAIELCCEDRYVFRNDGLIHWMQKTLFTIFVIFVHCLNGKIWLCKNLSDWNRLTKEVIFLHLHIYPTHTTYTACTYRAPVFSFCSLHALVENNYLDWIVLHCNQKCYHELDTLYSLKQIYFFTCYLASSSVRHKNGLFSNAAFSSATVTNCENICQSDTMSACWWTHSTKANCDTSRTNTPGDKLHCGTRVVQLCRIRV